MKDEYIKLEEAVEKFIAVNARSFDTDQIVYLLNKLPKYEMPDCNNCTYKKTQEYDAIAFDMNDFFSIVDDGKITVMRRGKGRVTVERPAIEMETTICSYGEGRDE